MTQRINENNERMVMVHLVGGRRARVKVCKTQPTHRELIQNYARMVMEHLVGGRKARVIFCKTQLLTNEAQHTP